MMLGVVSGSMQFATEQERAGIRCFAGNQLRKQVLTAYYNATVMYVHM